MAAQAKTTTSTEAISVTADNFNRAETDKYFGDFTKRGALGKFWHFHELPSIEIDSVRPNRDTLYSHAVWDLDAGPVTITLPDAGNRFMSMIVIDEDLYVPNVFYGAGDYTLNKDEVGTRYVLTSDPHARSIRTSGRRETGQCSARCHQGFAAWRPGQVRSAELGHREPR